MKWNRFGPLVVSSENCNRSFLRVHAKPTPFPATSTAPDEVPPTASVDTHPPFAHRCRHLLTVDPSLHEWLPLHGNKPHVGGRRCARTNGRRGGSNCRTHPSSRDFGDALQPTNYLVSDINYSVVTTGHVVNIGCVVDCPRVTNDGLAELGVMPTAPKWHRKRQFCCDNKRRHRSSRYRQRFAPTRNPRTRNF